MSTASGSEIWWVRDPFSGESIDNRFYNNEEEARARREELGIGTVVSWKPTGESWPTVSYYEEDASRKIRVFTDPE